jgi:hypothetical protein
MDKKAEINQIFVYLVSIIVIIFVGFLVIKFISAFVSDIDTKENIQIYDDLKKDFVKISQNYGGESVKDYNLASEVKLVCFRSVNSNNNCLKEKYVQIPISQEEMNSLIETKSDFFVFTQNGILGAKPIGDYAIKGGLKCICTKPKRGSIKVAIENFRNDLIIEVIE